jgi:hypothetical protein
VLLPLALVPVVAVFEQLEFTEFGAFGAVLLWPKLAAAPNTIRLVTEATSRHRA